MVHLPAAPNVGSSRSESLGAFMCSGSSRPPICAISNSEAGVAVLAAFGAAFGAAVAEALTEPLVGGAGECVGAGEQVGCLLTVDGVAEFGVGVGLVAGLVDRG